MVDAKGLEAAARKLRNAEKEKFGSWPDADDSKSIAAAAITAYIQAVGPEPAVAVKPLEWHKSRMPSWNDDWHTTAPIIYTVRCADENGWKWSFHGGQGYERSPEAAKAAAEADYASRIRSALVATPPAGGDDWTVDDTLTAREILDYLGIGSDASLEPYADRRRDAVAKIIQKRVATAPPAEGVVEALRNDIRDIVRKFEFGSAIAEYVADEIMKLPALATKPAVKDDETVVEALAGLCDWIENEVGAELPFDARAALSGSCSGWREPEPIKEVKALRQALLECRERAETGGRRIETAMDACEDISEIATCALPPEGWQGPAAPQQGGE